MYVITELLRESGTSATAEHHLYRNLKQKNLQKSEETQSKLRRNRSQSAFEAQNVNCKITRITRKRSLQQIHAKLKEETKLEFCPRFPSETCRYHFQQWCLNDIVFKIVNSLIKPHFPTSIILKEVNMLMVEQLIVTAESFLWAWFLSTKLIQNLNCVEPKYGR
jgi:hypothetical protein